MSRWDCFGADHDVVGNYGYNIRSWQLEREYSDDILLDR